MLYNKIVNWNEFDKEVRILASKIDFHPDFVVGIARGGVIPAAIIARVLQVKDMYVLKIRKEVEERRVMAETVPSPDGAKILLVEDMLETGESLIAGKKYLESKGAEVKTACLYTMPQTHIVPDYSLHEVSEVQKFPWE